LEKESTTELPLGVLKFGCSPMLGVGGEGRYKGTAVLSLFLFAFVLWILDAIEAGSCWEHLSQLLGFGYALAQSSTELIFFMGFPLS